MTEEEWLAGGEPVELLDARWSPANERKVRLCACACSRLVWSLFSDERSRAAVEVAERFADGITTGPRELEAAYYAALTVADEVIAQQIGQRELTIAHAAAGVAAPIGSLDFNMVFHAAGDLADAEHDARPVAIVRDVFGNPFRPVTFSPEWRTDTAIALARQMYDSREFGAMPILADALQDAGCDNEDILNHCRGETGGGSGEPVGGSPVQATHVRGCWIVDLVLGKE